MSKSICICLTNGFSKNMKKVLLTYIILVISSLTLDAQISDAIFRVANTNITIQNNKLITDYFFELQINNRQGEKYSVIKIPYSNNDKIKNITAYITDSNDNIISKLKKKDIVEKSYFQDFSFYEDKFIKEFILKHNTYPYKIIYSYQIIQSDFISITNWTPLVERGIPTLSAYLSLTTDTNYKIAIKNYGIEEHMLTRSENKKNHKWQSSHLKPIDDETFSQDISNLIPHISIVPLNFNYKNEGSLKNWQAFGDWQYRLLKELKELPIQEKIKIYNLVKNVEENKEKIKILYHYLQDETRYINVSIDVGGLVPYAASYVAHNKYGDCKALTNYFMSALDVVGISSYYTKIMAGSSISNIDTNFPSQQFNHIILYIPLDEEVIWLDCTSDLAFNYLGTFTQNRKAFVIDGANSHFVKTPALTLKEVLNNRSINATYSNNNCKVIVRSTYQGDEYENLKNIENNYSESNKLRILKRHYVEPGLEPSQIKIEKYHRDSTKIGLTYNAVSNVIYKKYGNEILLSNIPLNLPKFEKPIDRKNELQIDFPIYLIDTIVYQIPAGHKALIDSSKYIIEEEFGKYDLNITKTDNNIFTIKSLIIYPGQYSLSKYQDFYNYYDKIIQIERKTHIVLTPETNNDD